MNDKIVLSSMDSTVEIPQGRPVPLRAEKATALECYLLSRDFALSHRPTKRALVRKFEVSDDEFEDLLRELRCANVGVLHREIRLDIASELLGAGLSARQAAHRCGFRCYWLFCWRFRRFKGKAPGEWQQDMV